MQIIDDIIEMTVLDEVGILMQNHHSGCVSGLYRSLRNQVLRQVIIKITSFHFQYHSRIIYIYSIHQMKLTKEYDDDIL